MAANTYSALAATTPGELQTLVRASSALPHGDAFTIGSTRYQMMTDVAVPAGYLSDKYTVIMGNGVSDLVGRVNNIISDSVQPVGGPVRVGSSVMQVMGTITASGGGGETTVTSDDITDATTVGKGVLTAADAAAARTAIGAGTSNLTIGTTATTAMAGNTVIPAAYTLPNAAASTRGGVLAGAAVADSSATDVDGVNTVLNALLASLRASGALLS